MVRKVTAQFSLEHKAMQEIIKKWDTGKFVVGFLDRWWTKTKGDTWMCHHICFNDMLPRMMSACLT
jgi:hypothetical protein